MFGPGRLLLIDRALIEEILAKRLAGSEAAAKEPGVGLVARAASAVATASDASLPPFRVSAEYVWNGAVPDRLNQLQPAVVVSLHGLAAGAPAAIVADPRV
jgi:hypothetical protein